MGLVAVHLELSRKLCRHCLVFHVLLLHRLLLGGDGVKPPAPVIVKDVAEYEVGAFIEHR